MHVKNATKIQRDEPKYKILIADLYSRDAQYKTKAKANPI